MSTTIVFGKPGCGKTINANRFQKLFECTSIVDEWVPGSRLTPNALHLTAGDPKTKNFLEKATIPVIVVPFESILLKPDTAFL